MSYINYIFVVFILTNFGIYEVNSKKTCKDCIYLDQCKSADYSKQREVSSDYIQLVNKAYCGHGIGIKVCCSDFGKDAVQSHPNIGLLPDNCGPIHGNRILGGTIASLYEFPWMALISYQTVDGQDFNCAGSIINKLYILTAAHCIFNRMNILGVRVGEFDISNTPDCQGIICEGHIQDIEVNKTIYHENFNIYTYAFDIGLLRLAEPIDFTHINVAPICLPTSKHLRSVSIANTVATVAGWGLTETGSNSPVLLKVDVPIHPYDECFNLYDRILQPIDETGPKQFCAGSEHKDSCKGDSGAPLMIEDLYKESSRTIQYGIVSQGPKRCGSESPAIYTSVSPFIVWILDNLKP